MKKQATHNDKAQDDGGAPGPALETEPAAPAPEEIADLKAKAAKAEENWDRLLRATADFENFKKRAAREKQEAIRFANEGLIEKLVPVLDHFDMALQASAGQSPESLQSGVAMIYQQLKKVLFEAGLEEIDAAGKPFDPNWQEAVAQKETADVPEGHVAQQLRKGYKLRDRLVRPASVVVAQRPGETSQ